MKILIILLFFQSGIKVFSDENFDLNEIIDDRIRFYEKLVFPQMEYISEAERKAVKNKYRYLSDLKINNDMLQTGFPETRYGSDVWHLNEALCYALDLKDRSGLENWCETVDLETVCPPVFWNYSLLLDKREEAGIALISDYFKCLATREEFSELALRIGGQLIIFLNGEKLAPKDCSEVLNWSITAIFAARKHSRGPNDDGFESVENRLKEFVNNTWYQNPSSFIPLTVCMDDGRAEALDLAVSVGFDAQYVEEVCASGVAEKFVKIAGNNDFFHGDLDLVQQGDIGGLLDVVRAD